MGERAVLRCRTSCNNLAMTVLVPLATRYPDERCKYRALAVKQASCTSELWLMSDGVTHNEEVIVGIILMQAKQQTTGHNYIY